MGNEMHLFHNKCQLHTISGKCQRNAVKVGKSKSPGQDKIPS